MISDGVADGDRADRSVWADRSKDPQAEDIATASEKPSKPVAAVKPAASSESFDLLGADDDVVASAGFGSGNSGSEKGVDANEAKQVDTWFYEASIAKEESLVFENSAFSVSVFGEYRAFQGRLAVFVTNKSDSGDLHSLQVNVEAGAQDGAALQFKQQAPAQARLSPGEKTRVNIAVNCAAPFAAAPKLEVVCSISGVNYRLPLKLPVSVGAFLQPFPTDKASYMDNWKALTGPGTEQQCVFASGSVVDQTLLTYLRTQLLPAMHLALAEGLDNEKTATCAGKFLMSGGAEPLPVLMRLESDAAQQKFRVTIRAGHAHVALSLKTLIVAHLSM